MSTTPLPTPSLTQPPLLRARTLLSLLVATSQSNYIGESITQLEHTLQCAHSVLLASAPPTTVTGALLHEIGQFLPLSLLQASESDETPVGRPNHAVTGAAYLSSLGFPEEVCSVVREHVNAKKYLCATDEGYYAGLSEASKASLRQQGGPMGEEERREWEGRTVGWRDCVRVRRWDDGAKVVGVESETPRCERYVEVVAGCLR
jgi:predicted HD phosphohydrolase